MGFGTTHLVHSLDRSSLPIQLNRTELLPASLSDNCRPRIILAVGMQYSMLDLAQVWGRASGCWGNHQEDNSLQVEFLSCSWAEALLRFDHKRNGTHSLMGGFRNQGPLIFCAHHPIGRGEKRLLVGWRFKGQTQTNSAGCQGTPLAIQPSDTCTFLGRDGASSN